LETRPYDLKDYETPDGRCPFQEWFTALRQIDPRHAAIVERRIRRLEHGLLGDYDDIQDGILELRIHEGPGFRVYVRRIGRVLMLILAGGDKKTQKQDIRNAKRYWAEFKGRNEGAK
jgi:putative addiction module killer protein